LSAATESELSVSPHALICGRSENHETPDAGLDDDSMHGIDRLWYASIKVAGLLDTMGIKQSGRVAEYRFRATNRRENNG
jgi:hypothetical protein